MKNAKILTFIRAYNYGALLQAFALQFSIEKLGHKATFIDYRSNDIENPYKLFYIKHLKFKSALKKLITDTIFFHKIKKRYRKIDDFIKNNLKITQDIKNKKDLNKVIDEKDILITGSDQVFNKKITGESFDIYSLKFKIDKNVKKISYAASVGDLSYIEKNKKEYTEVLENIDSISIREEQAKEELKKLTNKKIDVVLDPTLLMSKEDWEKIIPNTKEKKDKYILVYTIAFDENFKQAVNYLSEKTGLKIIYFGMKNPGYKNVYSNEFTSSPFEFIELIKNASYVMTTSFHATVFSIIFQKNFYSQPPSNSKSRITDLLKKLGINNRIIPNIKEFKKYDINEKINWNNVTKRLENERKQSIKWLETNMK